MVQTEQQYICIHQCLLAVLEGKENIVGPAREMHDNEGYEGRWSVGRWSSQCLVPSAQFPVPLPQLTNHFFLLFIVFIFCFGFSC